MLLAKSDTSRYFSNATDSRKFKVDCKEPSEDLLELKRLIRGKYIDEMIILEGLLKEDTEVVVKIGRPDILSKEYTIGLRLKDFPNFIRYYCNFSCLDTKDNLEGLVHGHLKRVCTDGGKINIGVLVMPYYSLGDTIQCQQTVGTVEPELDATPKRVALHGIESYGWREEELDVLKNVLKQICFSLMYAYEQTGFLHNDEHLGNILLRKTSKSHLTYGDIELQLNGMYAVIMDFEKSTIGVSGDVYNSIRKLIHLICVSSKSDIMLEYPDMRLARLQSGNVVIKKEDYVAINDIIDNVKIRYVKSKVAQMKPKW
jgi:hypothetical protein